MKRYVSAIVGRRPADEPTIVLYLYNGRDGTLRYGGEMTLPQAEALYSQLDEAIALMKGELP